MMSKKTISQNLEKGQTIIETMVAAFVLVTGITAAVGLAIFALNSSTNTSEQIIGLGLAREGIEAVKNARDTNWLQQTSIKTDCYNYKNDTLTARCYDGWLDQAALNGYDIDPKNNNKVYFSITSNPSSPVKLWNITNLNATTTAVRRLEFDTATSSASFSGYYRPMAGGSPSNFYREITIDKDITTPPYDRWATGLGPLVTVTSRVWWSGKKCPVQATYDENLIPASCRVQLITHLTNWKNY